MNHSGCLQSSFVQVQTACEVKTNKVGVYLLHGVQKRFHICCYSNLNNTFEPRQHLIGKFPNDFSYDFAVQLPDRIRAFQRCYQVDSTSTAQTHPTDWYHYKISPLLKTFLPVYSQFFPKIQSFPFNKGFQQLHWCHRVIAFMRFFFKLNTFFPHPCFSGCL